MQNEKFNIYGVMLTLPYLSLIIFIAAYFIDKSAVLQNLPAISEKPYPKIDYVEEEITDDPLDKKLSKLEFGVVKKLAKEQNWEYSKGTLGNWKIIQTPHFYIQ
ncbi:hypothetical protein HY605_03580, partial [Candidatus Peregrinibacteria bacterium]|nr:hypothetical protein [Candidatus Peregrinibacteria bacterium]